MQAFDEDLFGVRRFQSNHQGCRVIIIVLTHGNEGAAGWAAHEEVVASCAGGINKGEITLLVGNPLATRQNRRFLDLDLNRAFSEANLAKDPAHAYEIQRFQEIEGLLRGIDVLIDIHTASQETPPFALSLDADERHLQFMQRLSIDYATYNWRPWLGATTMAWGLKFAPQAVSLTIECGAHDTAAARESAKRIVREVLAETCLLPRSACVRRTAPPPRVEMVACATTYAAATFAYRPGAAFKSFDRLQSGELIATDAANEFRAPPEGGLHIILPASEATVRQGDSPDAFYLGKMRSTDADRS